MSYISQWHIGNLLIFIPPSQSLINLRPSMHGLGTNFSFAGRQASLICPKWGLFLDRARTLSLRYKNVNSLPVAYEPSAIR